MLRSGRPSPGGRAVAVMLLLLLAAVVLFPVDREHHHTLAHPGQHVTLTMCPPPHHETGEPVPAHGHRHEADVMSNLAPRARPAVPDAAVVVAAACRGATDTSAVPGTAATAVPDVDLSLLGVLRV
jgi:hypothetical protein